MQQVPLWLLSLLLVWDQISVSGLICLEHEYKNIMIFIVIIPYKVNGPGEFVIIFLYKTPNIIIQHCHKKVP